ncbi:hypothetical protein Tco_1521186 [Tanacetum coccineum]
MGRKTSQLPDEYNLQKVLTQDWNDRLLCRLEKNGKEVKIGQKECGCQFTMWFDTKAGVSGVLRNEEGHIISVFSKPFTVLDVEMFAIFGALI